MTGPAPPLLPPRPGENELARLERENAKLRKINRALMGRVERSMDYQGNAFALFQAATVLETKVRERTLALLNALEDLETARSAAEAAKTEAEQANLSKTRFLAAAGHDLLQPLNAARVFVSALGERRLSPANRDLAENALAAMDSLDEILTTLLDISKLDAGAQPVAVSVFRLSGLFGHLAEEYRMVAARKNLSLRFVDCSLTVHSDPHLLGRIMLNFLSNAIRYTEPGGRILIGCRRRGDQLLVGVWDTGVGVPADRLEEIFEEFRRLDDSGAKEKGMGLGLAIVRRISLLLGHRLEVRSQLGRGSLFGVVVPVVAEPAALVAAPPPPAAAALQGLVGARVLVVDDDAATLSAMRALLEGWKCETVAGLSAETALGNVPAASWRPDVVIADYHLQDGELGLEVIAQARARFGSGLPAVVITGNWTEALQEAVREAGCQLLRKPVRPGKLRSLLVHLLDSRGA